MWAKFIHFNALAKCFSVTSLYFTNSSSWFWVRCNFFECIMHRAINCADSSLVFCFKKKSHTNFIYTFYLHIYLTIKYKQNLIFAIIVYILFQILIFILHEILPKLNLVSAPNIYFWKLEKLQHFSLIFFATHLWEMILASNNKNIWKYIPIRWDKSMW